MTLETSLAFRYSRYVARSFRRTPGTVERIASALDTAFPWKCWNERLGQTDASTLDAALRELRREVMLYTLLRDINGRATLSEVVREITALADLAVQTSVAAHSMTVFGSHTPPHKFSVVAMGKMGGGELNVSSDIDIVFACDEPEQDSMDSLQRLANAITRSIDREIDGDFVFRVDTRLRPYGNAGPLVPTLDFIEHYFVAQGRMWERLAWLRSRVCAGELARDLDQLVTPFVYRRYLDFDAVAGLRELHTQLRSEKTDPRNVKLGRGGIRELEFGVQLRQLLRGGRDPRIRVRTTADALAALADGGYVDAAEARAMTEHYGFLRRLEHFLQYRDDLQTQTLPSDAAELDLLAEALGAQSASALATTIDQVRQDVAAFFDRTLAGTDTSSVAGVESSTASNAVGEPPQDGSAAGANANRLSPSESPPGFADQAQVEAYRSASFESVRVRALPARSRERLEALSDRAASLALATDTPDIAFRLTLDLLVALASRSSYLALMTERTGVLRRVVDLAATSEWAVRYVAQHPLLLDELIDARALSLPIDYATWRGELARAIAAPGDDTEAAMDALRHFQQAETFRLLMRDIAGQFSVETLSDHLSALADVCVDVTLAHLLRKASLPASATLAVIAYGKWGSKELGYAGDLDLVFLMPDDASEHRDQLTRIAQRLQSWLTTMTAAGRAYEIDVRLRPDGVSGLLLSTTSAFETYQREKAWTWEHQALTRARFAAGDRLLGEKFETIREAILALPRDWYKLSVDIQEMRDRIAKEHPNRDRETQFDLKHDAGGLVDMEFAVQAIVLRHSPTHVELRRDLGNIALVKLAATSGLLGEDGERIAVEAADAYRELRRKQHALRLRGVDRARMPLPESVAFSSAIRALWQCVF